MTKVENTFQREILSLIRFHKNGAKYSQLRVKGVENDLFNYHLQQLVKNKYLQKKVGLYQLTELGKSLVTNIDEDDKKLPPNYKVSVCMCVFIDNKVLLYKRLKHPQYGYIGMPSGKIKYGEKILDAAKRELNEETGLKADFKIIGNLRQIRKNNKDKVIEDGVFFVCYTDKIKGQLKPKTIEGEFFWKTIPQTLKLDKLFKPSVEIMLKEATKRLRKPNLWKNKFTYELHPNPEEY